MSFWNPSDRRFDVLYERDYDPYFDAPRDEPPDPTDDDFAMALFDATTGEFFDV